MQINLKICFLILSLCCIGAATLVFLTAEHPVFITRLMSKMRKIPAGVPKSDACNRLGLNESEGAYTDYYGHPEVLYWELPRGYRLLIAFDDERHGAYQGSAIQLKRNTSKFNVSFPHSYSMVYTTHD